MGRTTENPINLPPIDAELSNASLSSKPSSNTHQSYFTGVQAEQRVGVVLETIPGVSRVIPVAEDSDDNLKYLTDLIVVFDAADPVRVQVKASNNSMRDGYYHIGKSFHVKGNRREWFAQNRLVMLNGGVRNVKRVREGVRTKEKIPVTDEEIIADFTRQVQRIHQGGSIFPNNQAAA